MKGLSPVSCLLSPGSWLLSPVSCLLSPELMAEVRAGLAELAASLRGGKRAGSGRKPRETRRTMVLLSPAARTRLEELAKQTGSLSAAVEKAVMALRS